MRPRYLVDEMADAAQGYLSAHDPQNDPVIETCEIHGDYERYCMDCFLTERRRELAQETKEGMEESNDL